MTAEKKWWWVYCKKTGGKQLVSIGDGAAMEICPICESERKYCDFRLERANITASTPKKPDTSFATH